MNYAMCYTAFSPVLEGVQVGFSAHTATSPEHRSPPHPAGCRSLAAAVPAPTASGSCRLRKEI